MLIYRLYVNALKHPVGSRIWRRLKMRSGANVGSYGRLPEYIKNYVPGKSFADIGCMWGVNGEYSFLAEEAGATEVKAVDVFGPTPEFEATHDERRSRVEFILGDAGSPETIARVGQVDVVFCAGVLYHHPSPYDLLVALRRMCRETLILRTSTVPELPWLRNAAVYFPLLEGDQRKLWQLQRLGLSLQVGISDPGFEASRGYGNWFWGLTPSCLRSLLQTAGFALEWDFEEPFAQTVICRAVEAPFAHRLPGDLEARTMAEEISAARTARPA